MQSLEIFLLQLSMSIFIYTLAARWIVQPWLSDKALRVALMILIAPHATRHMGMTFMVPSVASPDLSLTFAQMVAYGDLMSAVLAILALFALRQQWRFTIPLIWIFNIVGTVDLLNALSRAENVPHLSGVWFIPTFVVPLLLVTHAMIFIRLLKSNIGDVLIRR